jgi:hypothetical protein
MREIEFENSNEDERMGPEWSPDCLTNQGIRH